MSDFLVVILGLFQKFCVLGLNSLLVVRELKPLIIPSGFLFLNYTLLLNQVLLSHVAPGVVTQVGAGGPFAG